MKSKLKLDKINHPDRMISYFKLEKFPLLLVTLSGISYNLGMTAGPYFEGQLAQRLYDIMKGRKSLSDMLSLVFIYLIIIGIVQFMRYIKRFFVRRFANNTSRNMRHMLYNSLVHQTKEELESESVGAIMTKAVSDVDACVEGMRKFTTEVFDTGIVLFAYFAMLLYYDYRLTLIACLFTPVAYFIASKLKKVVMNYTLRYKKIAGKLNDATLDNVTNAMTYRIYGCEEERIQSYEKQLKDYEKASVLANIWENTMQPIYNIISMIGVIFIIYFGAKNVIGTGWTTWNIAAFATFFSCFTKLAYKSSKAAKLFNSVQKAKVSWTRIKPFMKDYIEINKNTNFDHKIIDSLTLSHLSFSYSNIVPFFEDLSMTMLPGEIIGVTGPVASGKSSFGKIFLCEQPYTGSVKIGPYELSTLTDYERSLIITYMGHQPELMSDTIKENIQLGEDQSILSVLSLVCMEEDILSMPDGILTDVGNSGTRLSGGQQSRIALARTLYHGKQIIILDDPFSAIDKKTEQKIMENLRTIGKDKIIILISHRLGIFPQLDQMIWLDGEHTQIGNHETQMHTNPNYARLYKMQSLGGDENEAS